MSQEVTPFTLPQDTSTESLRNFIAEIEKFAVENGSPIEIPIAHYFSNGVYGREMKMPQGAFVVGKIHKHQNMNVLSEGEVSVLSVDGVKRISAPSTFVASPGAKRVIYAHTPVTWTTFHATTEKDLSKIEDEVIAKTYDDVVPLLTETKKELT